LSGDDEQYLIHYGDLLLVELVLFDNYLCYWLDMQNGKRVLIGTDISCKSKAKGYIAADVDAGMLLLIPATLGKPLAHP